MDLVLGSGSPRRKELLSRLGYNFIVKTAEVEESSDDMLGLEGLCIYNAQLKAQAVYDSYSEEVVVLGSDTVVWLDGVAYGKPTSESDAVRILSELSGRTHQVGTGVALISPSGTDSYCEISEVKFKALSEADILSYIHDVPVMDKAGAYAIQDGGERIVQSYQGEFETIMGLPLIKLENKLKEYNL